MLLRLLAALRRVQAQQARHDDAELEEDDGGGGGDDDGKSGAQQLAFFFPVNEDYRKNIRFYKRCKRMVFVKIGRETTVKEVKCSLNLIKK